MSNASTEKLHEPLFHIAKRGGIPVWKGIVIRAVAILIGLIVGGIIIVASTTKDKSFFEVYSSLVNGIFGTERRWWLFLQDTCLLLGVSLALVVAFKMKFWNLGGNGQILMGCLASTACMFYFGGKAPTVVVNLMMVVASILAGAIWAVIPALFKAFFKTNESLFTLMMNYVAMYLIKAIISAWYPTGTGTMSPLNQGVLPTLGQGQMGKSMLTIIVVVVLTAAMFAYLKFSKHGYELSVVGESENTARYIGVNVKAVVIRTMVLSGAVCGVIGLLLSGSINHTVSDSMDGNMGFTGIMAAWLGKFNPLIIILTSAFITFVTRGMAQVRTDFGFTNSALADIVIGIIYFCVIGCEFFVSYQIHFNSHAKEKLEKIKNMFKREKKAKEDEK